MSLPPSASSSRSPTLKESTSRRSQIVHHKLDVKGWIASPPTPEDARPGMCVICDAPSRPTGGRIGLHGHGFRDRQICGPPDVDSAPTWIVIACRRYQCTTCDAILTVVPRGVAPRRHYGHAAIAMALTLWAITQESEADIRRRVCARQISVESPTRWPTLVRWARAARDALGATTLSLKDAAAQVAQIAIGRAPPGLRRAPQAAQAFAGGSAMP